MLLRIAVIVAAVTVVWVAPLAAQAPDQGGRGAAGGSMPTTRPAPVERAALETRAPPDSRRAPSVQRELVEKAAKDSIRSLDLQTELTPPENVSRPIRLAIPQEALYLTLALVAALLLYSFREELTNLFRRAETGWEPPPPGAGEVTVGSETDALSAADRLSREGNFVEAMHVLLLHSLAEIRRQLGEQFADSLTSREILRVARLTAAARTALREIVAVVERTYFGAYPAEARDYAACRQNFATLQQALRGGAPT
jgi:hypothetical protein